MVQKMVFLVQMRCVSDFQQLLTIKETLLAAVAVVEQLISSSYQNGKVDRFAGFQ
jgi:hypothetical protein